MLMVPETALNSSDVLKMRYIYFLHVISTISSHLWNALWRYNGQKRLWDQSLTLWSNTQFVIVNYVKAFLSTYYSEIYIKVKNYKHDHHWSKFHSLKFKGWHICNIVHLQRHNPFPNWKLQGKLISAANRVVIDQRVATSIHQEANKFRLFCDSWLCTMFERINQ